MLDSEAYVFDEEVLKKAADLGKPGLVEIKQLQNKFIFRVEGTGVLPVRLSEALVVCCICSFVCVYIIPLRTKHDLAGCVCLTC